MYLAKNDTPYSAAYAKLELPASPWELWDAMEKVRLQTDDTLQVSSLCWMGLSGPWTSSIRWHPM